MNALSPTRTEHEHHAPHSRRTDILAELQLGFGLFMAAGMLLLPVLPASIGWLFPFLGLAGFSLAFLARCAREAEMNFQRHLARFGVERARGRS